MCGLGGDACVREDSRKGYTAGSAGMEGVPYEAYWVGAAGCAGGGAGMVRRHGPGCASRLDCGGVRQALESRAAADLLVLEGRARRGVDVAVQQGVDGCGSCWVAEPATVPVH